MANYIAHCRSNYFQVKSVSHFLEWCASLDLNYNIKPGDVEGEIFYALFPEESWPCTRYTDENPDGDEIDFLFELSEHLAKDQVAIVHEIGYEKMRYLCGISQAVNEDGAVMSLCLSDMTRRVEEEWGIQTTEAEY